MSRTLTALLGLVCCLTMSACTGDDVSAAPPTTTASSSTSMSPPTTPTPASTSQTPQEPQPPKLPAVAKEMSPAGAKAFVKYYIDAVNYAWLTQSTELLKTLSTAECLQCTGIAEGFDRIQQHNGETEGAIWRPKALVLIPFQPDEAPIVNVAIATSRGRWKPSATSPWRPIQPSITHWDMHLSRAESHWVMTSAVVQ